MHRQTYSMLVRSAEIRWICRVSKFGTPSHRSGGTCPIAGRETWKNVGHNDHCLHGQSVIMGHTYRNSVPGHSKLPFYGF